MKIALSGYYGFDNAGDEALLSAICFTIKKFEPRVEFVVFSGSPQKTSHIHGLPAVNRMNPWVIIRELWQSDLLISGGGSLLQDVTGPRSLPYYISIVALAKILKKPVIFYAQGIGPINRRFSKFLMRLIANRVDLITLRDKESLQLLKKLRVTHPPVKLTADPVFTLDPSFDDFQQAQLLLQQYGIKNKNIIGVSVREWKPLEGYQQPLAKVLDYMAKKGYQIVFIPLNYPDDLSESRQVAELMEEKCFIINNHLNSIEYIALIAKFDLLIGMRLHSLIFAANRGIPFAGISYDPKIDAFLKSFNLSPIQGDYQNIRLQVEQLLENRQLREKIQHRAQEMRSQAEESAYLALSLIR
jgi:polysaccharide pyruvyl transferase CsaB